MKRFNKMALICMVILCVIFSSSFAKFLGEEKVSIPKSEYEELLKFKEMFNIYEVLDKRYYIEPDEKKLIEGSIRGMMSGLDDPYSVYYTPEEFEKYWEEDSGEYAGVGMQITSKYDENICVISRVFQGSPAEEAGIKKGDILIKAGDIDVYPNNLQEAVDFMRGKKGTKVKITMLRGDEELLFDVERRDVHINQVETKYMDGDIGLIQLYQFSGESGEEFSKALNQLIAKGAKGIIVDLRDNPGGWVNNARDIADLFVENDTLCYFQYRDGTKEYIKTGKGKMSIPMSIIINENSASASELFTGAMQDYGLADVVGTVSYGKGIAQEIMDVGDKGAGFQFTVAQYFTPKGRAVHKKGITPDYIVELGEDINKEFEFGSLEDPQLKKAYDLVIKKVGKDASK